MQDDKTTGPRPNTGHGQMQDDKTTGPRPNTGHGQQKTYDITGVDPATGAALPPRTVTQEQWRIEKLGKQGYVKPADLAEEPEPPGTIGA